jgi:hypothetical protein
MSDVLTISVSLERKSNPAILIFGIWAKVSTSITRSVPSRSPFPPPKPPISYNIQDSLRPRRLEHPERENRDLVSINNP